MNVYNDKQTRIQLALKYSRWSVISFIVLLAACASPAPTGTSPQVEDISSSADVFGQTEVQDVRPSDVVGGFIVQARGHLESGNMEKAAAAAERAIRIAPSDPRGYFALAQIRYYQTQYLLSTNLLKKARSLARQNELLEAIDEFFKSPGYSR